MTSAPKKYGDSDVTIKGTGRRQWRSLYPADDWENFDSFYVFHLKYVLLRKKGIRSPNPPAAILCFDHSEGMHDWEVIGEGNVIDIKDRFFEMKRTLSLAANPAELPHMQSKALKQHPDFGRF